MLFPKFLITIKETIDFIIKTTVFNFSDMFHHITVTSSDYYKVLMKIVSPGKMKCF